MTSDYIINNVLLQKKLLLATFIEERHINGWWDNLFNGGGRDGREVFACVFVLVRGRVYV